MIDERDYYQTVDLPIYDQELREWLPDRIFDAHTHSWLLEHVLHPISEERVNLMFEAESLSWEDLASDYRLLFPGKAVEWLAFPMPITAIDRTENNAYVARCIDGSHTYGLYVPGLEDTAETLWAAIHEGGFLGFKPYHSYVTGKPVDEIRVVDFVRVPQLEVAEEHALIIMLHLPRPGRIGDPVNQTDVRAIAKQYPHARIVLAHGGRAYGRAMIESGISAVIDLPNVYFDLSNVYDYSVVRALLEGIPLRRILFGTDDPVATVRGMMLLLNGQRVFITRKRFRWSVTSELPNQLRCTFFVYEQLRAMKQACQDLHIGAHDVQTLFYDNVRALIGQ